MARISSPYPISGSVGDLTFYSVNGKTFARNKPGITREKFLTHPKLQRSRENAQNFGGASKLACAIYRDARGNQRGTASPYAHNQLIARICRGMNRRTRAVEEITFMDVAHLLRGIDLSRGQEASKRIAVTTIGPNHNPTSLRISDIPSAASLAQGRQPGRIECRIQLNYIRFPQVTLNEDAKWDFQNQESLHLLNTIQSDWIPTEILPTNGLTLNLLPHSYHSSHSGPEACAEGTRSALEQPEAQQNQQPQNFQPSSFILHQNQQQNEHPTPPPARIANPQFPPTLVFLQIQFRHINEDETKAVLLRDHTILRLAALQMDEATAQALANHERNTRVPKAPGISQEWRKNPETFLVNALQSFQTNSSLPSPPA